ncbi:YciI family protein [Streptosporangium sp. NPDC005286]|uniref:YciI family protein n=1 Tax=Streptosporangium sp. NPDC005286 TaxID=3154463 RepID=UPI0033A3262A
MTMRFLMTTKGGDAAPPSEAVHAEMAAFVEEMTRAGVLLATGGLDPAGLRVSASGGEMTVTDGPFTETKEAIVSFALIEARSQQEAIELSRRFWKIIGEGEGTIQQVFGPQD